MDALSELIEHCKPRGLSPLGKRFYVFHKLNKDVLDFFMQELVTLQANGWTRTSFGSLWHHARWVLTTLRRGPGETFAMSQNMACHYARAIVILRPEFNGFFVMEKAAADSDFGTRIAPAPCPPVRGHVRKLQWADGTAIENGWRPTAPHEPQPVRRRELVTRELV